jgi:hypothetical protein
MKTAHKIGKKEGEFRNFFENSKTGLSSEEQSRIVDDYRLDRLPREEQSVIIRAYRRIMSQKSN